MTDDAFKPNRLSKYLEKLTYSTHQHALFVSNAAFSDYNAHINLSGKASVLYNFIREEYYKAVAQKANFGGDKFKLVSVGNLRPQKGYLFLIKCLKALDGYNISLDIYGEGSQRGELETYIEVNGVKNVRLMGSHPQPWMILKEYDAFVLATQYEGFCLAMAEAMAVGLPCIVPAIDALVEISGNKQLYFDLNDHQDCIEKIMELYQQEMQVKHYSKLAYQHATRFSKAVHIEQLVGFYEAELKAAK
ncbi:hypothetical protein GCM10023188_41240 [Pontibacter saemangeumensis]|uniref:Glycosyl transferase family 1 domain-containing protein n=2 Tax=Pontibacter saemangeumensis TaxID=1084525 RepID=A0ABP8M0Q0_9BACT